MRTITQSPLEIEHHARLALAKLAELGLAPLPELYTLFFAYAGGSHPELTREIEARLAGERPLASWECLELHDQFFGAAPLAERCDRLLEDVRGSLHEGMSAVDGSEQRRQWLTSFGRALENLPSAEGGRPILGRVSHLLGAAVGVITSLLNERDRIAVSLEETHQLTLLMEGELEAERRTARTCALTGVTNRRGFEERLRAEMKGAADRSAALSLGIVDIDHFKSINDSYGHKTGDLVLVRCAAILREMVGERGLVARIGGEEFALLLGSGLKEAYDLSSRIRRRLEGMVLQVPTTKEPLRRVTASFGVTLYNRGETVPAFMERADRALYAAKGAGRNKVVSLG